MDANGVDGVGQRVKIRVGLMKLIGTSQFRASDRRSPLEFNYY